MTEPSVADRCAALSAAPAAHQSMPVRWRPGPSPALSSIELAEALRTLGMVAVLDERPSPITEEATGLEAEVARLQIKTQLVLEVLGSLLSRDQQRPEARPACLGADGLRWQPDAPDTLTPGLGQLELHLHPLAPHALRLPAELLAVQDHDGEKVAFAMFSPLPEVLSEALEKHVFLHHRREVAEARSRRASGLG